MPAVGWHAPDLFVLRHLALEKVVEVVVLDPYENGEYAVAQKVSKIRDYYDPPEIVVFEPVEYLDRVRLPDTVNLYRKLMGLRPNSYRAIEEFYAKKWKKEHEWNVTFWNEKDLRM